MSNISNSAASDCEGIRWIDMDDDLDVLIEDEAFASGKTKKAYKVSGINVVKL